MRVESSDNERHSIFQRMKNDFDDKAKCEFSSYNRILMVEMVLDWRTRKLRFFLREQREIRFLTKTVLLNHTPIPPIL